MCCGKLTKVRKALLTHRPIESFVTILRVLISSKDKLDCFNTISN